MGLVIDLTKEQEEELHRIAAQQGYDSAGFIKRMLDEALTSAKDKSVHNISNGADLTAYWDSLGLFGSRPDITDSSEHARGIRRQAERQQRAHA